jgi:hypothetical protein
MLVLTGLFLSNEVPNSNILLVLSIGLAIHTRMSRCAELFRCILLDYSTL